MFDVKFTPMSATFIIWTTLQASNNARGKQWTLWCCYDKKHMSSPMFLSGVRVARTLCFCVMVCRSLVLSVWSFCLAIELSVLLRFETSNWQFGIFKHLLYYQRKRSYNEYSCLEPNNLQPLLIMSSMGSVSLVT